MIHHIQSQCTTTTGGTLLGIGDDAAILQTDPNQELVISTDTLVADVHFKSDDSARSIGHKSLAVNISDMAAMGALPKWALLNLTLPEMDTQWLKDFTEGFADLLQTHQVQLIGGDTTQGPLSITVTVMGYTEQAIRRSTAQLDDLIVVSGRLGSAAYALHNQCDQALKNTLHQPTPRTDIAQKVKSLATSMIDISDGLLADLGHICNASKVGAVIELSQVPVDDTVKQHDDWQQYVLAGGDDYQLCFTIDANNEEHLPEDCHIIGQIIEGDGIMVLHHHQPLSLDFKGYQHFDHE
ncbi:MAG: thiamine-phosphate kinase [Marinicella sp.]